MHVRLFIITIFFFLNTSAVISKPTFIFEGIDKSKFPEIEIRIRENMKTDLGISNLVVAEEMDGLRTIPIDLEIHRDAVSEPIQLVVSIQPTDSKAINQWSTDLVLSLSTVIEKKDRLAVHIQEDKRFLFLANQSTDSLQSGFILPSVETYSKTLESISFLLDKLSVSERKPPFLLIVLHSRKIPDRDNLIELSKKSRRMGIPIHILGFDSSETRKLTEYTDANFYSLEDKNSTKKLFEDIQHYKKPPYRIKYSSRKKIQLFDEKTIQVDIGILNVQNLSTSYRINIVTRLEDALRDPSIFLPTSIFFLLICITALFLLPRIRASRKNRSSEIDSHKKTSGNGRDEESVYEHMYGKKEGSGQTSRSFDDEYYESSMEEASHNSLAIQLNGEAYERAILIQKEGPSPGRQFNINQSETIIGRSETSDFVIWDNSVSPQHAKIRSIEKHFILYDLLSSQGIFLNGKKLLRPKVLFDFDEIRIGKTLLIFRGK
ncbi:FHA domain-containing protein [Leptospira sp. GIMC2001]|uniref:FHA domain-containing protein n=1 Tax=Leptospira sp. GIMC2001 TaxID=1513297 RepID=UPI0023492881|nr:FHA domain-containing protein [Leptospira sp. GIMC2001]WCL47883.1 FHA domain-containing protein [Leptospira sp. GIMC2001]